MCTLVTVIFQRENRFLNSREVIQHFHSIEIQFSSSFLRNRKKGLNSWQVFQAELMISDDDHDSPHFGVDFHIKMIRISKQSITNTFLRAFIFTCRPPSSMDQVNYRVVSWATRKTIWKSCTCKTSTHYMKGWHGMHALSPCCWNFHYLTRFFVSVVRCWKTKVDLKRCIHYPWYQWVMNNELEGALELTSLVELQPSNFDQKHEIIGNV